MPESTFKRGYHVLVANDVTAGEVTVTPSVQPTRGRAELELAAGARRGRGRACCVEVSGTDLIIKLPKWAPVDAILHWVSYEV